MSERLKWVVEVGNTLVMGLAISIQISELCSEQKGGLMRFVPDGTRAHHPFSVPPMTPDVAAPLLVKA